MHGRADSAAAHQVFTAVRRAGGEEAELHPLRDINNKEIEEVKQLKHPPREVARVMEVVHLLLSLTLPSSIDWGDVLRTVVRVDFLKRARNIDMEAILEQPRLIDYICRRYFAGSEPLTPDRVRWASKAVVAFFGWTVAIIAGCLPAFPAKVGGEESRRRIILLDQELREERRQNRDAEEQHRAEKQRREVERQREKQHEEDSLNQEQARQRLASIEAAAADKKRAEAEDQLPQTVQQMQQQRLQQQMQQQQQLEQLESEQRQQEVFKQRRAAKQRKLEAKIRHKKRVALGLDSDESGSEAERCRGVWNSNNPDIRFLRMAGAEITFLSDEFADHCTAVSCRPMHYGQHFYEFIVHHFSDQLRCGVTTDAVQAGALVAGHNLRGWCYNTGPRKQKAKTMPAGLQVNGKVVQEFSSVDDGDVIGVLVDADRWSIAFLKNRVLEGSCAMSSHAREPLYLLLHMDAAGDHVNLRHVPLQEAPADALAALESFSPPSWQTVVSDCSDCSSVSEGEGIPGPSAQNRPRSAGASGFSEPLSGRAPLERDAGPHPMVPSVSSSAGDLRVASKSLLGAAGAILAHKPPGPPATSNPPGPAGPFPPAPTTSQMPRDRNDEPSVVVGLKARLRELKDCLDEGLLTMDEFQEEKGIILRAMRPSLNASGTGPGFAALLDYCAASFDEQNAAWHVSSAAIAVAQFDMQTQSAQTPNAIVLGPQRRRIPQDRYKDNFVSYHRDLPRAFLTASVTTLSGWRCRRCRMTCKPSQAGEMKQVPPPNRWVTSQPVMTPSSSPITLRPDMRIDEVIRILLRSNAVCVGDAPDGVFFVKVAQNGDDTQDPGLACINLADLLEAPRQLPLDCLLGLGDKEECDLYSSAPEPYVGKSVQTELYGRLPWLLGLLVFLSVSSAILEFFDVLLQKHLIIAFYLTALVGCGGNAGSQAASLVLQALATGELVPTFADFWRVLRKELLVALGIAATLSLGIAGRILLFGGSAADALAIALAMAVTVSFSVLFGASAPLLLQRAGADPAKVSGPLLSTVIDIAGVLVACLSAQLLEAVGAWDTMEKL
ncbi:unnamed protein product [Symbiodinium sp. CCMP2456]|nr:unnamed protein product [Symbiodinium sp. CCMP2456]